MARHRSEAPPAPRHAWNEPDDGVGDPFGDPRGVPSVGVDLASPPAGLRVDPFGDRDPFADRDPFGDPMPPDLRDALGPRDPDGPRDRIGDRHPDPYGDRPASPAAFGLPVLPEVMPEPVTRTPGADRSAGAVPAPRSGPVPSVVPPPRSTPGTAPAPAPVLRHPELPEPRPASGGRHSWMTPPAQAEPVTRASEPVSAPIPAPAPAPTTSTPQERPASGPPSGPVERAERPRGEGRRRAGRATVGHDPETTPLDLAAIALASARTATGSHRLPPTTGSTPALTGRSGPLALAGADTGGHRITAGGRGLHPTRTAGALAVAGALVSAGVAVLSSGSMLASADSPGTAGAPAVVQHHEAPATGGGGY